MTNIIKGLEVKLTCVFKRPLYANDNIKKQKGMERKLTSKEIEEQELAEKIAPLIAEWHALLVKREHGITVEKDSYIGERSVEIANEIAALKATHKETDKNKSANQ
jgi:hypothetical protein